MENMVNSNFQEIYKGKRVFVTGHTGFKGSWLTYVLQTLGAELKGYSLPPNTSPSLYKQIEPFLQIDSVLADINDSLKIEAEIIKFQPDFVFHLAAQPLVRKSYKEPINTFSTNVIGTANVLNALLKIEKPCSCIFITTDKVYENKEWHYPYRETDRLGGYDPYSASKACAELVIDSFRNSFFNKTEFQIHNKAIASVRAGNVIGGGDWSEDRLLPDIVKSIIKNEAIIIRNPLSIRPWQHVLEPVFGYLQLGAAMYNEPLRFIGAWNFGPDNEDNLPVMAIARIAIDKWRKGTIKLLENQHQVHETQLLKLDINKIANELGWKPKMNTVTAVEKTIDWYKSFYEGQQAAAKLIESDILFYQSLFHTNG